MHRYLVATSVAVAFTVAGSGAHAFSYLTCNGNPTKWNSAIPFTQHLGSLPIGSAPESAYLNALNRWNAVEGMTDMLIRAGTTTNSTISHGDGQNDVGLVNRADIDGNNGLTINVNHLCVATSSIVEADVMIAADLDFNPVPSETSVDGTFGRSSFIHEFGHALGLEHFQSFNQMRVPMPRPMFGGPGEHIDVLPDDAAGGRFLYSTGNTQRNVFASAQRRDVNTDTIVNNATGTVVACSGGGGAITVNATVGNNGTTNITQTERWFVSTNPHAYGGTQIFQWNNSTYNAGAVITVQRGPMTLPPLPVGTYYLFHAVDVLNQVNESREDDNVTQEALTIQVISC